LHRLAETYFASGTIFERFGDKDAALKFGQYGVPSLIFCLTLHCVEIRPFT
jgi:hypothetical protein